MCCCQYIQAPAGAPAPQPAAQATPTTYGVPPSVPQSAPTVTQQPQQYTFNATAPTPTDATRSHTLQASVPAPKTRFGPAPPAYGITSTGMQEPQTRQEYTSQASIQQPTILPTQMTTSIQPDLSMNNQPATQDGTPRDTQVDDALDCPVPPVELHANTIYYIYCTGKYLTR